MLNELRHAFRLLIRNPRVSVIACLILALGIGANTAIFSVVDAALFRALPYTNADRLVDLLLTEQTLSGDQVQIEAPSRDGKDLRAINEVFDGVDAYAESRPRALAIGSDQNPWVGAFTPTLPVFLGVTPELGRGFTADDVLSQDAIIISDAYWQRAFNRDAAVLGRVLAFSDGRHVIVGVMPATFRFFAGARTDAWLALAERDGDRLVARLRRGLGIHEAQRTLNTALARPGARHFQVQILQADWTRRVGSAPALLLSLLGAVGFVLAIACANVANLLLSRAITRQREVAVRGALGATRLRLMRQFLIEGAVVAGGGGVAAVVLAWCGIRAIPALVPANLSYKVLNAALPELDLRVLTFACLMAILTAVLCGALPALWASRSAVFQSVLTGGQRIAGASRGQRRVRDAFQALQVALTLVLLAGAALLLASFIRLVSVPAGFDSKGLGYADLTFPESAATPRRQMFVDELAARVAGAPGVTAVTIGNPPVAGSPSAHFLPERTDGLPATSALLEYFLVRPDYFQVTGIRLKEGRTFGPEDGPHTRPVAIIGESAAARFWPGQSPIGRRFRRFPEEPLLTVVGVARDVRTINLARDGVEAYLPIAQWGMLPTILFRTTTDPTAVMAMVRAQAKSIDPRVTVARIGMIDHLFAESDPLAATRFYTLLLGLFAAIAVLTAAVGLYGVLSYSVSRRTQEIGVRVALGADLGRIRWLMIADVLRPVATGIVVGLLLASWLSRFLASQLFRVSPNDPVTFGAIAILFALVSAVAAFVPVRQATRIDPAEALRTD